MMQGSVLDHDLIGGVTAGDGTMATVAILTMRNNIAKVANIRIKAADGRSLSVRLDTIIARRLHEALGLAIRALPEPDADYRAATTREEWNGRPARARRSAAAHLGPALPGSLPTAPR